MHVSPEEALTRTLSCLQEAVDNNYVASFFVIASGALCMHYEMVVRKYGMCPTAIAIGPKTTVHNYT